MWIDVYTCQPCDPDLVDISERVWIDTLFEYFEWCHKNYPKEYNEPKRT